MKRIKMMPVHEAVNKSIESIGRIQKTERRGIAHALGYKLAESIKVEYGLPPFDKSTVDGYAVRSSDIEKASGDTPVTLKVVGESEMGKVTDAVIESGQAQYVPTGAMIPEGADTMVMIEDTDLGKNLVQIYQSVEYGANIIGKGADLKEGSIGIHEGVHITVRHIGLLAAMGVTDVLVRSKPRVAVISNGDEIIDVGQTPVGGQIFDINTHSLKALCMSYGLEVNYADIVKDDFEALCESVRKAHMTSDVILMSGGSSVGEKDMTVEAVKTLQDAEVIVHGLAFKPGKPTLIAKAGEKIVLGLPGHPVSALMVMDTVGRRILDSVWDINILKHHRIEGILTASVTPAKGRDSCQMVRVEKNGETYEVVPMGGKSGMISWIGHSDGYIVAEHKNGTLVAGTEVIVYLWDQNSVLIDNDWI